MAEADPRLYGRPAYPHLFLIGERAYPYHITCRKYMVPDIFDLPYGIICFFRVLCFLQVFCLQKYDPGEGKI